MQALTLAIDTSCDDTSVAVVRGLEIWSNVVASQVELHKPYGGVFPTVAKLAHKEHIWPAVALALRRAHVKPADIQEIAVTIGPGLAPALEVGISAGLALATAWQIPLRPANHLEGHLMSVLAKPKPHQTKSSASQGLVKKIDKVEISTKKTTRSIISQTQTPLHKQSATRLSEEDTNTSVEVQIQNPNQTTSNVDLTFPILGVLISGGHSAFFHLTKPNNQVKLVSLDISVKISQSALELALKIPPALQTKLRVDPYELDFSNVHIKPVVTNLILLDRYPNLGLTDENSRPFLQSGAFELERLGGTLDDAAGEALDKIGRMLNLGYPAGPVLEQFAKKGNHQAFPLPLPLTQTKTYDLSYSGMKTHTRNLIESLGGSEQLTKQNIFDLSASVQYAVFRHICYKLNKILEDTSPETSFAQIWLGGGVAANATLRKMIRRVIKAHQRKKLAKQTTIKLTKKHVAKNKNKSHLTQPEKSANLISKPMMQKNSTVNSLTLQTPYSKRLCGDNAGMVGMHK